MSVGSWRASDIFIGAASSLQCPTALAKLLIDSNSLCTSQDWDRTSRTEKRENNCGRRAEQVNLEYHITKAGKAKPSSENPCMLNYTIDSYEARITGKNEKLWHITVLQKHVHYPSLWHQTLYKHNSWLSSNSHQKCMTTFSEINSIFQMLFLPFQEPSQKQTTWGWSNITILKPQKPGPELKTSVWKHTGCGEFVTGCKFFPSTFWSRLTLVICLCHASPPMLRFQMHWSFLTYVSKDWSLG